MSDKPECNISRHTLIIEDDASIRETFKFVLEFEGYKVLTAQNGKEGLELLSRIPKPCLIFLDLMMPIMNGLEFLKRIEKDENLATIPVVIVSAFTERAKDVHVKEIISKPVDLAKILNLAKEFCPD